MRTRCLLLATAICTAAAAPTTIPRAHAEPVKQTVQLPIYFESNQGQFDASVVMAARTRAYTAFFTTGRILLAVPDHSSAATLEFVNGARITPVAAAPLAGRVSYLRGPASQWRSDIPTFGRVQYPQVYPGIDVEFYARDGRLEYDFILAPGANPDHIAIAIGGDGAPLVTSSGDLEVPLATGRFTQHRPVAYQERNGVRRPVDVRYRLDRQRRLRLDVAPYDRGRRLVIDPLLTYSSSFVDDIEDMAFDAGGNIYVAGSTFDPAFPTTAGAFDRTFTGSSDVFVAKLTADASAFVYATFLGGSVRERVDGLAVDAAGNAYVTGDTVSADFPTTAGAWDRTCGNGGTCQNDAFAVKLNPTGSALVYSTFIGGADTDLPLDVAIDASGRAVVIGVTRSPDFPTTPGAFQQVKPGGPFQGESFIVKLNAAGSAPEYSTYFGGAAEDVLLGVVIDASGNAIVTGETESFDLPVVAPLQPNRAGERDAVVAKFTPTGTALFVTYLGGPSFDGGFHVDVDAAGNIYVLGQTFGGVFPATAAPIGTGGHWDAFVAKLTASGTSRTWSTVIGGSDHDRLVRIDVDSSNRAHITGGSSSPDFPVTADALQRTRRGPGDAIYATLNTTGTALVYSTYFGGTNGEIAATVRFVNDRAWFAGLTDSSDFPQVNTSGTLGKPGDEGWIARFDWNPPPVVNDPRELVLYAADAQNISGAWRLVDDPSAAAGQRIQHPNAGAAKITTALANPVDSFELAFTAEAGVPYRLWIRGKADANYWGNDSVFVQFSNSVDQAGSPIWRIGTTSATAVTIEDCVNCGLSSWGWNDNGFGGLGPVIRFASTGEQRLRIQTREDGLSIDQVVLSAARFISTSPGATKNDSRILPPSDGSGEEPPPPDRCDAGEIVLHAIDATVHGEWAKVADSTAASSTRAVDANAGAARVAAPLAAPANYIELTFQAEANVAHRLWIRGKAAANNWANDSAYVQFSDSVTASGEPIWQIGTTSGTRYQLEECTNCGVSSWGWNDNEFGGLALGTPVRFATTGTHTIRIQTREDGLSIDQIVLSKATYFTTAPGPLKNDTTILEKCARPAANTTP